MTATIPPIGTAIELLVTDDGGYPEVLDAIVVTGEVSEPADLVCRFVAKSDDAYFRVHDLCDVNPDEGAVKDARRRWATAFLAQCADADRFSASAANEAERILRGEE